MANIKLNKANGKVITIDSGTSSTDLTIDASKLMYQVDTISALRALTETPDTVYVTGYHTANDGAFGNHFFKYKGIVLDDSEDNTGTVQVISVGGVFHKYELQHDGS